MIALHRFTRSSVALAAAASLLLAGCSSPDKKAEPTTAGATTSATATTAAQSSSASSSAASSSTAAASTGKVENMRVYLHNTMALGAPMVGFGSNGKLSSVVDNVKVDYWNNVTQLRTAMIQHEAQLAATPAYTAANMYNKGIDARMVAQVVWGMIYVIGPDSAPEGDWSAMKGQKVAVVMPGEMVDLVFTYLLNKNGMNKDTDIQYVPVTDPRQAVGMLAKGEVQWAVLPEQLATVALLKNKDKHLKRVLNLQTEYGKATGGPAEFPMAGLVMEGKLIDEHPELPKMVLTELQETTKKVDAGDPEVIAAIAKQYDMPEELVKNIIPRLGVRVVAASEARPAYEEFLKNLGTVNPDIYGGKLPDDKFYAD